MGDGHNIPVRHHTLANGLRMVHSYDPTTAMAAVNILYNVGSRDESRHRTGMAHLFEHLMFGGSANVPSFDGELENAGGKSNAWTSPDFTNFYDTLPAQNIATAFHIESDRMLALDFSERSLEVQRGVVIEEFKQTCLNRPYGDISHHLRRLAYAENHPYAWPTIGLEPEHIASVTLDDVKSWFYSHYAPDNAILSVTGRVEFDRAVELAERWFADIPRRNIQPRRIPAPGFPRESIVETVYGRVPQPMVVMAFPMDSYGTERYYAADTVTDLLAAGRASRFVRRLVYGPAEGIFASADASIIGSEHEGLLLLTARVADNDDSTISRACELLLAEARAIADPANIGAREYERTINNFEATFRFGNIDYLSKATNLALAEYHGEDINATVAARRSLRPEAVAAEADRLFSREKGYRHTHYIGHEVEHIGCAAVFHSTLSDLVEASGHYAGRAKDRHKLLGNNLATMRPLPVEGKRSGKTAEHHGVYELVGARKHRQMLHSRRVGRESSVQNHSGHNHGRPPFAYERNHSGI